MADAGALHQRIETQFHIIQRLRFKISRQAREIAYWRAINENKPLPVTEREKRLAAAEMIFRGQS